MNRKNGTNRRPNIRLRKKTLRKRMARTMTNGSCLRRRKKKTWSRPKTWNWRNLNRRTLRSCRRNASGKTSGCPPMTWRTRPFQWTYCRGFWRRCALRTNASRKWNGLRKWNCGKSFWEQPKPRRKQHFWSPPKSAWQHLCRWRTRLRGWRSCLPGGPGQRHVNSGA